VKDTGASYFHDVVTRFPDIADVESLNGFLFRTSQSLLSVGDREAVLAALPLLARQVAGLLQADAVAFVLLPDVCACSHKDILRLARYRRCLLQITHADSQLAHR